MSQSRGLISFNSQMLPLLMHRTSSSPPNNPIDMETGRKVFTQNKSSCHSTKVIAYLFLLFLILILFHIQASPFISSPSPTSTSWAFFRQWKGKLWAGNYSNQYTTTAAMLREPVTFQPLKDLRFADTAMMGKTWFMSSLNDTYEENEAEYLYFPSQAYEGRLLCIKGRDVEDGTKNSYALAWPENLPDSATFMKGLTFISDTYYDYENLWHGLCAMAPLVGWSLKNECLKPTRWILFHWGEIRDRMGSWIQHLMRANFGEVNIEGFGDGGGAYCFDKAVVMRHDLGRMGPEKMLKVFDLLRCKARSFCGLDPEGTGKEVNEKGVPIIRFTLLMRRGSRSFKNAAVVADIFARECTRVEGCILKVKVMTNTDIVASSHGAQLTNMLFMDRNSSVMEFFPKGWLEHAGLGQYAHHWMANQAGMKHEGAWWDPVGDECPTPEQELQCFLFHKDGKVGHNETFFAEWAKKVLNKVRISKQEQISKNSATKPWLNSSPCAC